MALANYGDLKTAIAAWTARADLTTVIPDFVALTHADLMRDLRGHLRLQKRDTAFSITGEYVAAPSDFLEVVSFVITSTTQPFAMSFLPNDTANDTYGGVQDIPQHFTLVGSSSNVENFRFSPPPNGTYTATLEYYARLTFFANDAATNWILTDYPNLYLYGSLYHAFKYMKDPNMAADMLRDYGEVLALLKKAGNKARWGGNGMTVRPG